MNMHWNRWRRFSLLGLMLFVLVAAVAVSGLESWRRAQNARSARAEFVRLLELWQFGANVSTEELIDASQRTFKAERDQWLSSLYTRAIVDSHLLRLTRIRDGLQSVAETGLFASEEAHAAAWKRVDEVSRLIQEAEEL